MTKKLIFTKSPISPATPWLDLSAVTRGLGELLFKREFATDPDRVVLGFTLECVVTTSGEATYPQVESWALRVLSPDWEERKTIRRSVRAMVAADLIVPVENAVGNGFRFLYWPESYDAYHAEHASDSDENVDGQSGDGGSNVPPQSGNGHGTVNGQSADSPPTVSNKPAKSLGQPRVDRERDQKNRGEREKRTRSGPPPPEGKVAELWTAYEVRYAAAHDGAPVTWSEETAEAAEGVQAWLERVQGGDLEANRARLLEGFFGSSFAASRQHKLKFLAQGPEEYFERKRGGGGGGYAYTSPDHRFKSSDPSRLGPRPPMGAAE